MMKRILVGLLLMALLLPGMALGQEEEALAPEVYAPGFTYHTLGTEAAGLVSLRYDRTQVAGDLFILEDGYLSVGYEIDDDVMYPHPAGKPLICQNSDQSVRWTLTDQRLDGAWYDTLLELPDALVLGVERSAPELGQAPSVMLVEKETGEIRWQMEGNRDTAAEERELVCIGDIMADADGNILVASDGELSGSKSMVGTLSLLDAQDGAVMWSVSYLEDYGVELFRDICTLGDGLLLYGLRAGDEIVLHTDRLGAVRGWFTFQPWTDRSGYTVLRLSPSSAEVAYLTGWEMEQDPDNTADIPFHARTLYMMRLDEAVFRNEKTW